MDALFEHRIDVAGHYTRALESPGEGPGIVLLHGWGDSADVWRALLEELSLRERRAIAVDLPGFGRATSLKPGAVLPQLDAFAAELVRGWSDGEPVVVAGSSLGGCLALRLAERVPERVERVVALAPAGLDMARWLALIEHDHVLRLLVQAPVPFPPRVIQTAIGRVYRSLAFADPERIEPGIVRNYVRHHPDRAALARMLASGRRMLPELHDPFDFSKIGCKVLLVWGDGDRLVFHRGAQRLLAAVEDSRLELIERCGHAPQLEHPDRVVELLLEQSEPLLEQAA